MKSKTIPLSYIGAAAVPIGNILAGSGDGLLMGAIKAMQSGDPQLMAKEISNSLCYETTGYLPYKGTWDWTIPARNVGLIVAAVIVHRLARPINAKLRNVPFVGKYVSI